MQIIFSGKYAKDTDTFGVNFEAKVNGEPFVCKISPAALDDIEPNNLEGELEQKFLFNRSEFEAIAKRKICDGAKSPVFINSADVCEN